MAKEQSGRNTLLFLSECGRGVDILNLFRCLFSMNIRHALTNTDMYFMGCCLDSINIDSKLYLIIDRDREDTFEKLMCVALWQLSWAHLMHII